MPPSIEYTFDGLTLTVTGWAEHKGIKRSAMSNRVSRFIRGETTAERCFGEDIENQNTGNWGDLDNTVRNENLNKIPDPTDIDKQLKNASDWGNVQ